MKMKCVQRFKFELIFLLTAISTQCAPVLADVYLRGNGSCSDDMTKKITCTSGNSLERCLVNEALTMNNIIRAYSSIFYDCEYYSGSPETYTKRKSVFGFSGNMIWVNNRCKIHFLYCAAVQISTTAIITKIATTGTATTGRVTPSQITSRSTTTIPASAMDSQPLTSTATRTVRSTFAKPYTSQTFSTVTTKPTVPATVKVLIVSSKSKTVSFIITTTRDVGKNRSGISSDTIVMAGVIGTGLTLLAVAVAYAGFMAGHPTVNRVFPSISKRIVRVAVSNLSENQRGRQNISRNSTIMSLEWDIKRNTDIDAQERKKNTC